MTFTYIIIYTSILVWTLPPFKQYKGCYFYFFLVLASGGLLSIVVSSIVHFGLLKLYDIISFLLLLSLYKQQQIKKNWYWFFIMLLILLFMNKYSDDKLIRFSIIALHIIIFYIILKNAAIDYNTNNMFNIGYFILLLYEITVLLKFYLAIANIHTGAIFFYLMTAFESFIAIFFTIYKVEKAPSIKLALGSQKH